VLGWRGQGSHFFEQPTCWCWFPTSQ